MTLDRCALMLNAAGRGAGRAATLGLAAAAVARRGGRRELAAFALAQAATPAAVNLVKLAVREQRPGHARIDAWGSSFPSGHAAYAAATGTCLALTEGGSPAAWSAALALTTAMAWSRVHLGAHRRGEVAVGALLGFGVAAGAWTLAERAGR